MGGAGEHPAQAHPTPFGFVTVVGTITQLVADTVVSPNGGKTFDALESRC